MKKILSLGSLALLAALIIVALFPTMASAHGHPEIGKYTLIIGFVDEPAYQNMKNSIDLAVCDGECKYEVKDGQRVIANPVNGLEKTLKVEVIKGSAAPLELPLKARYGQPGKYVSYFLPTEAGAYTFHLTGTIGEQKVDEKYTSGPEMFSEVAAITTYPTVKEAAANTNQAGATNVKALEQQVKDAQATASTANTIGIVGAILGVLGLATAAFALSRKPAVATSAAAKTPAESLRG